MKRQLPDKITHNLGLLLSLIKEEDLIREAVITLVVLSLLIIILH